MPVVGGAEFSTVTLAALEVVTLPASSVARTDTLCAPLATVLLFQVTPNGDEVSLATLAPSIRKSTRSTRRSSETAGVSGTAVPLTVVPGTGAPTDAVGAIGWLPSA